MKYKDHVYDEERQQVTLWVEEIDHIELLKLLKYLRGENQSPYIDTPNSVILEKLGGK